MDIELDDIRDRMTHVLDIVDATKIKTATTERYIDKYIPIKMN